VTGRAGSSIESLVKTMAGRVSPAHRRWRRLLSSATLDPDELASPLRSPGPQDFIICGAPRSGTSLVAAVLHQPPKSMTVMEPWDGMRMAPADLFDSLREEMAQGWLRRGRLDVDALRADGEVRWGGDGEFPHRIEMSDDSLVGVKWPAFWRYLGLLPRTKFLVCIRHPAEVISSYGRQSGRLHRGFEYDIPFNERMNRFLDSAADNDEVRRVLLYDYINLGIAPYLQRPNVFVVRYERWFDDGARLLSEIGRFLGAELDRSRAVIRRPPTTTMRSSELALTKRHCTSAAILGYRLDEPKVAGVPGGSAWPRCR
jgi:hypothetical protein